MFPCYSKISPTSRFVQALSEGLRQELDLTPKPGLVDRHNSGSHTDLSYGLMSESINLLEGYFSECANALESGCGIETLRDLGIETENRMLRQFGTNTHRGAVFLGGLMIFGVHEAGALDGPEVSRAIASGARRLFRDRLPTDTTGAVVRERFQVGGIVAEALNGLPCVFEIGVPTLQTGLEQGMSLRNAQLLAMALLMQQVEDTTALRRCGPLGLARLQEDGRSLERLLLEGKSPDSFLILANRRYQARRLTMGGVADILGMSIAWHCCGLPDLYSHAAETIEAQIQASSSF
ncbi:MAG: triphosphoribosyl-dephospho-CoA synthase [Sedimenticola sp.]